MIRRLLVIGSVGLAVAGGARYGLKMVTERAWEHRRQELLALALMPESVRRPWELRYESLAERLRTSPRLNEITNSPYRVHYARESGAARPLDPFERVWLESLWGELDGLDGVLAELRLLPLEALGWHGEVPRLQIARELTNALCGRAWLALEGGDAARALQSWTDALRLARATDDGTLIGTMIRANSELTVLTAVRSGLELGAPAAILRAELMPYYLAWGDVAARAEHAIRRDLSLVAALGSATPEDPAEALGFFRGVEESLAETHLTASAFFQASPDGAGSRRPWSGITAHLHDLHARRNVAFTALSVAAWRAEHGRYPDELAQLDELEPELALDPRTGRTLPYESDGASARVGPPEWAEPGPADSAAWLYCWDLR